MDVEGLAGVHEMSVTSTGLEASVDPAAVPVLIDRLARAGIVSLEIRPPTLEEMFMRYYDRADQP